MTENGLEELKEDRMIWWLASYPKSGNTWVRIFLDAYAKDAEIDINNLGGGVIGDNQPNSYRAITDDELADFSQYDWLGMRYAALRHLRKWAWTDGLLMLKTHNANAIIDHFPLIPWRITSGAVYVVRDPRDVALSYANHFDVSVDDAITAMNQHTNRVVDKRQAGMFHVLGTWSKHVDSWLGEQNFKVGLVKYEELLAEPVRRFSAMLQYLDFAVDTERVERAVAASSFDNLRAQEDEHGFKECSPKADKFFHKGRSTWRESLTEEQVRQIEIDHGAVMDKLGYEREFESVAA